MVRIAANIEANKLPFLGDDFAGIKVTDGVNNSSRLFCGGFFVLGLGAAYAHHKTENRRCDPTKAFIFFHAITNKSIEWPSPPTTRSLGIGAGYPRLYGIYVRP